MQQLANNVILGTQSAKGTAVSDAAKLNDNAGFFDALQQAQSKLQGSDQSPTGQLKTDTKAVTDNANEVTGNDAGADDQVATVLGQISMGKKLPPDAKLQKAVTKLAELAGLDQQQLQQLADSKDPKQLLQQLAAMMTQNLKAANQTGDTADSVTNTTAVTDDSETVADSLAKLMAALAALLQQADNSAENAANTLLEGSAKGAAKNPDSDVNLLISATDDKAADDKKASTTDDDTSLADALAALFAVLQPSAATPAQASNTGDDAESLQATATTTTPTSPSGQLQQLLAQLMAADKSQDKLHAHDQNKADSGIAVDLTTLNVGQNDGELAKFSDSVKAALENAAANFSEKAVMAQSANDKVAQETSPLELKSIQALSPLNNAGAINRNEMAQYQLSLRAAGEQLQPNTQELIQRFAPAMKQQLLTMVNNGVHHAEIRLDPPELGAMTVKVQVQGEHTQVQFHVTQTHTKDLLEQSMPRLRDLLQQQGMQLADGQVSQGGGQQSHAQGNANSRGDLGGTSGEISGEELTSSTEPTLTSTSAIDYYA
ncbi:flagellar hook-length control protein FliK [Shewanella sp. A32]|uniref:flagellar hook-length control protein FliK n=1 Tax=Shewanella sp. A32 TaxID=3031327 RepID=UPI0023B9A987|nr:flagellar hook-length control protein FliK [Shewanella sp. A32]MDF0532980.1 flagellar hook-length control protein FliK [Shewanella sp. A32]